ncbi:sodium-dependent phosphate transport protein 2B-like [Argopecten irradians]|uniref:sodium-dependent phosphate transport protein 2B-like n=1 Tax=Argopecten irradians TaxID=31199 RepID=UPI00371C509B
MVAHTFDLENREKESKDVEEMEESRCKFIFTTIIKFILFLAFLYLFICSLDFLSSAFRLLGGKMAGEVFRNNAILRNPVTGLMIGVLSTVLVQSSSTSTSIVVSLVGAQLLDVKTAIPIVMGANIGTSVTNTIVALGQITSRSEFRRAFAGATVHDMFNWMTVIIFLPLEVITGYLFQLSEVAVNNLKLEAYSDGKQDFLKVITKPFTKRIIQVDKKGIEKIAQNEDVDSLLKICCKSKTLKNVNETFTNGTTYILSSKKICVQECEYIFKDTTLSDNEIGGILLVASLVLLCFCLFVIVKLLNSILQGKIRKAIKKFINYEFPGRCGYFTGYLAIVVGCGLTILVQSSSIFTSTMTPLVGVGVVSLERMYPLTLGSNIGTTTTGILAALAQDGDKMRHPLQVAFCHLFFNLSGILLFYPIPFMRFPIPLAKFLGKETSKYRWFSILYLICMFFLLPLVVFALSMAGWEVMTAVLVPVATLVIMVAIIKILQAKKPNVLPTKLRDWKFLPICCRSLEPVDRMMNMCCCEKCTSLADDSESEVEETAPEVKVNNSIDNNDLTHI